MKDISIRAIIGAATINSEPLRFISRTAAFYMTRPTIYERLRAVVDCVSITLSEGIGGMVEAVTR